MIADLCERLKNSTYCSRDETVLNKTFICPTDVIKHKYYKIEKKNLTFPIE